MIKKIIRRYRERPTVFLILCTLTFITGIPATFWAMGLDGGASLIAVFPIGALFFAVIGVGIDYGLVNHTKIKLKWINLIEIGGLILSTILVLISHS